MHPPRPLPTRTSFLNLTPASINHVPPYPLSDYILLLHATPVLVLIYRLTLKVIEIDTARAICVTNVAPFYIRFRFVIPCCICMCVICALYVIQERLTTRSPPPRSAGPHARLPWSLPFRCTPPP